MWRTNQNNKFGRAPKVTSLLGWEELSPPCAGLRHLPVKDCRLCVEPSRFQAFFLNSGVTDRGGLHLSYLLQALCEVQTFRLAFHPYLSELCGIPHRPLAKPSPRDQVLPMLPLSQSVNLFTLVNGSRGPLLQFLNHFWFMVEEPVHKAHTGRWLFLAHIPVFLADGVWLCPVLDRELQDEVSYSTPRRLSSSRRDYFIDEITRMGF